MLNYILGVCINHFILGIVYILGLNIEIITGNLLYFFIFCTVQLFIMHPITASAGALYRKLLKQTLLPLSCEPHGRKILALLSLEIAVCGFVFIFNVVFGNRIGYSGQVLLFNGILFFILFSATGFILYHLYQTLNADYKLRIRMKETEAMAEYTAQLENLYGEIRSFKHDYMNILSSLYAYLDEGRYEELKQYFETKILPDGRRLAAKDSSFGKLAHIRLPDIKGILYTEILKAANRQLSITLDISSDIVALNMESSDLVRILGILLDNAIEAAMQTEKKELYAGFLSDEQWDYIRITNSTLPVPDISCLAAKGYSSKDGHEGIGLYEVEQLLNRHPQAFLNTEYKDGTFIQLLCLQKERRL